MDVATVSLLALLVTIVVSCTIRLHVGFLAIALAWLVGLYADIGANQVMAGFPTRLFLTLAGVTLLFSQAQANGTLDRVAHRAVLSCRGNAGVIPMMFFVLAFMFASIGPGNIAATAIIAPMAMAVAGQVGIPAFLVAIMVGKRRERRLALADRADRHHRQRHHGQRGPGRLRVAQLPQ